MDNLSGIFEGLAIPFNSIAQGINDLISYINPASDNFFLKKAFVPDDVEVVVPNKTYGLNGVTIYTTEKVDYFTYKNNQIKDKIYEKFPLIEQLNDFNNDILGVFDDNGQMGVNSLNIDSEPPELKITLPSKWGGFSAKIVDFSFYAQYRNYIHGLMIAISYFFFIRKLIKRLPGIVHMAGGEK